METLSALLALCAGNPPITDGFPSPRPVTRNLDVLFDLRLNKRLSKQSRRRKGHRAHYDVIVMPDDATLTAATNFTNISVYDENIFVFIYIYIYIYKFTGRCSHQVRIRGP